MNGAPAQHLGLSLESAGWLKSGARRNLLALALAFFCAALVYSVLVHFTNGVYPEDDAYITYRYVDNLVAGKGLVYNESQHVFGASTPLYIVWLALVKLILPRSPTPDIAVQLNFLFYLATGIGLFLVLKKMTRSRTIAAAFSGIFVLNPDLLLASTGGMESFLFTALLVWSFWALAEERWSLSGLLSGLSALARPEGVLAIALVFVAWLFLSRKLPIPFLAGLLLPGVTWVVFGFAYFGTPVYHSIIAKSAPLYPLQPGVALTGIWWYLRKWTADGSWTNNALLAVILLAAAAVGYYSYRKRLLVVARAGVLSAALLLLYLLFYLVTNPLLFPWYLPPIQLVWFIVLVSGIVWLLNWGELRISAWGPVLLFLFTAYAAYPSLKPPISRLVTGKSILELGIEDDAVRIRTVAYRSAAEWLNRTVPENTTLAGTEIGSLGYYYRGPIIDACGLVSPEVVRFLPVPDSERYNATVGAISRDCVRTIRPEVIATLSTFAATSLYDYDWFNTSYVRVKQVPLPRQVWGTGNIDIFFRRDSRSMTALRDRVGLTETEKAALALDSTLKTVILPGQARARSVFWPSGMVTDSTRLLARRLSDQVVSYAELYKTLGYGAKRFEDYLPALAFWISPPAESHPEVMSYMNDMENYISGPYRFTLLFASPDKKVSAYLIEATGGRQ